MLLSTDRLNYRRLPKHSARLLIGTASPAREEELRSSNACGLTLQRSWAPTPGGVDEMGIPVCAPTEAKTGDEM